MPYKCWSLVRSMRCVSCVKGSSEIHACQKRNIARVMCKKDVIGYSEKGCFSAMGKVVSGLRRTDEIVFSEIGKQLL